MTTTEPIAFEEFLSPALRELEEPANRANPYPVYKRYRDEHPIHRSEIGIWTLTRYTDILSVLRDERFSSDPRNTTVFDELVTPEERASDPIQNFADRILLFTDPPNHTRMRTLVNKAFTPRTVEGLRPHIGEIVRDLIDQAADGGEMDVIRDFAYPLPALVICELMGVPVEDRDKFKGWSGDIAPILDPITPPSTMNVALATLGQFAVYFSQLIEERRERPTDDLLSRLIAAEQAGERLAFDELLGLCVLIFIAGHETTQNLIGNGLLALLRHPDQKELLASDTSLVRNAIEELLRYDSPVQLTARNALADIDLAGNIVKKGEQLILLLGAGNRDPEIFPDPDRLDVRREDVQVVSFGAGMHFCLGAALARVEGQVAFTELLTRFPNMELNCDEPEWRSTLTLRGLKSLPVRWSA